jgi:hypothetical protein
MVHGLLEDKAFNKNIPDIFVSWIHYVQEVRLLPKRTDTEAFASEYCMSAGDNASSRKQINKSIVSKATANEHSFREASMEGLDDSANNKK